MKELIDEHPEGPYVCLWAVDIINEPLRAHVDRGSDVDILEFGMGETSKPKICYFCLSIMDEDVGDFQVAVYDMLPGQILQSFEYISDEFFGLALFHVALGLELAFQVALIAEFSDDVAIAVTCKDFLAAQHVGVIQFFEDLNLGEEQFLKFFAFETVELDDFDGDDFTCMMDGVTGELIVGAVDFAEVALSKQVVEVENVVLDLLEGVFRVVRLFCYH